MKLIIILSVFLLSACASPSSTSLKPGSAAIADSYQRNDVDVLAVLNLSGAQYGSSNYSILKTFDISDGGFRLEVVRDRDVIKSIELPNSTNVKNFSVDKVIETKDGFQIYLSWGGGNFFYHRQLFFTFKNGEFYLARLGMNMYVQDSDEVVESEKKIDPPVSLTSFDIRKYVENE